MGKEGRRGGSEEDPPHTPIFKTTIPVHHLTPTFSPCISFFCASHFTSLQAAISICTYTVVRLQTCLAPHTTITHTFFILCTDSHLLLTESRIHPVALLQTFVPDYFLQFLDYYFLKNSTFLLDCSALTFAVHQGKFHFTFQCYSSIYFLLSIKLQYQSFAYFAKM